MKALQAITRRILFGHVALLLGLVAAVLTYGQAVDGLSPESASLFVFLWTLIATYVSREFYEGDLRNDVDDLRASIEDWRATVVDFRQENQELERENEELRETIKELSRENYALRERVDDPDAVVADAADGPDAAIEE